MDTPNANCDKCLELGKVIYHHLQAVCESEDEIDQYEEFESMSLGRIKDIAERSRSCPGCRALMAKIGPQVESNTAMITEDLEQDVEIMLPMKSLYMICINPPGIELGLLPFAEAALGTLQGVHTFARCPKPTSMDIEVIRGWIRTCQQNHKGVCSMSAGQNQSHVTPRLLIDLEQRCVIADPDNVEYVALSYVWGRVPVTMATKSNIESLSTPGGLDQPSVEIPATIRDAMLLTSLLGWQYLWVDSFCIIQDDYDTKQPELMKMGEIYRNAALTIIAAEGDNANYGISGVPGGTRARSLDYQYVNFLPDKPVWIYPSNVDGYRGTMWDKRAWTFQEALFSFQKGHHLYFDTTSITLYIGHHLRQVGRRADETRTQNTDLRTEDGQWAGIIRHNSTHPEDLLHCPCKLIVISMGEVRLDSIGPLGIDEWDHPERYEDFDTGYYSFYNALWVEENNGISYRKALGRVVKDVWDAHPSLESVSVVLG